MSSKTGFWDRYALPLTLFSIAAWALQAAWRADARGTGIVYWNRNAPVTPQQLCFAAAGFIIVGVLLLMFQRTDR